MRSLTLRNLTLWTDFQQQANNHVWRTFITDANELSSIQQDLSNVRKVLEQQLQPAAQQQDAADEMAEMGNSMKALLPLLMSAIEKLHLALKKVSVPDSLSQAMMEETIMDLAAAVDQSGHNDEEQVVDALIASHSSVVASILKSSIAVLYEWLEGYHEDMTGLDFTTIPILLADNPTAEMILMPGTTASSTKDYTVMGDCPVNYDTAALWWRSVQGL
jgi:hypothetical protein